MRKRIGLLLWRPDKTRPASHPAIPHKMFTLAPGNSTFHYFNNRTRHVFPLIFPPCNWFPCFMSNSLTDRDIDMRRMHGDFANIYAIKPDVSCQRT